MASPNLVAFSFCEDLYILTPRLASPNVAMQMFHPHKPCDIMKCMRLKDGCDWFKVIQSSQSQAIWDQDQDLSGESITPNWSEQLPNISPPINLSSLIRNTPTLLKPPIKIPYIQLHSSSGVGSLPRWPLCVILSSSSLRLPLLPTTLYIDRIYGFMSSAVRSTSSLLPSSLFYKKWEGSSVCCFKLWTPSRRFTASHWSTDGWLGLFSIRGFFPPANKRRNRGEVKDTWWEEGREEDFRWNVHVSDSVESCSLLYTVLARVLRMHTYRGMVYLQENRQNKAVFICPPLIWYRSGNCLRVDKSDKRKRSSHSREEEKWVLMK